MKFYSINSILLFFACLISCSNKSIKDIELAQIDSSARVLLVNNTKAFITIPKDSIFEDQFEVIPLETTLESLISQIGRIAMYNGNFYILDRKLNSILIFNRLGKFIKNISHIGGGPGEYISLTDFGLDIDNNNIILYCDRPKKIIIYSLEHELQDEISIQQLFESISIDSQHGKLIGLNRLPIYKDYFITYDFKKKMIGKSFVPITSNKLEKMFRNYKTEFPLWIKSKNDYCVLPYINTIHKSANDTLEKSFNLNFKNKLSDIEEGVKISEELIKTSIKDNLGFWFSNFREYNTFITFSFGRGTKVFYPKKDDKYIMFDFVQNKEFNYPHSYHFAHDYYGDTLEDSNYIFVEESTNLIRFYNELKNNSPADWDKVNVQAKEKLSKISLEDNPILFIYKIKK